jgi:hypothetical protein
VDTVRLTVRDWSQAVKNKISESAKLKIVSLDVIVERKQSFAPFDVLPEQ